MRTLQFERVYHNDSVTGKNDHFGALLFDEDGSIVRTHGGEVWLYTGSSVANEWTSNVRLFDPLTLEARPKSVELTPRGGDTWATIHLAIQVTDSLIAAFYTLVDSWLGGLTDLFPAVFRVFHVVRGWGFSDSRLVSRPGNSSTYSFNFGQDRFCGGRPGKWL